MLHETIKTEGVIIKEREMGENDKLYSIYSEKFGKIEILGKAIRKPKAKLRGGFQVLNYISLEFVKGKNFNIATDIMVKEAFSKIKKNPKIFRQSLYICDLLEKFLSGEERDNRIWNLILETLYNIEDCNGNNNWLSIRYFEWNLISFLGFEPEIYYCIKCGEKIKEGKIFFSKKEGGILCNKCFERGKKNEEIISRDIVKILRLFIHQDKKTLKRLKITNDLECELKKISHDYLEHIIQEKLFVI